MDEKKLTKVETFFVGFNFTEGERILALIGAGDNTGSIKPTKILSHEDSESLYKLINETEDYGPNRPITKFEKGEKHDL